MDLMLCRLWLVGNPMDETITAIAFFELYLCKLLVRLVPRRLEIRPTTLLSPTHVSQYVRCVDGTNSTSSLVVIVKHTQPKQ